MREFVEAAVRELGMEIRWQGRGAEEKGYDRQGRCIVAVDPRYFRPAEVETLLGDAAKARGKLGWQPRVGFKDLVAEMVQHDLHEAERSRLVKDHGYPEHDRHA